MPTSPNASSLTKPSKYVSFVVGSGVFAVDILKVQEINVSPWPQPITSGPDCLLGVIQCRGKTVPVVDLNDKLAVGPTHQTRRTNQTGQPRESRSRQEVESSAFSDKSSIILMQVETLRRPVSMGFRVDEVLEILDLGESGIGSRPAQGEYPSCLVGTIPCANRSLWLVDPDQVFTDAELEEILRASGMMEDGEGDTSR